MENITKSQEVAAQITGLLRARMPLLWVESREVNRVERYLIQAANAAGFLARTWDCAQGVCDQNGAPQEIGGADPMATFAAIRSRALGDGNTDMIPGDPNNRRTFRCVWIMRNLPDLISGPAMIRERQALQNLVRFLPSRPVDSAQAVIVLSSSATIPDDLQDFATVIPWPLPDRAEVAALLDATIASLPEFDSAGKPVRSVAAPNGQRDAAIDAAVGLSELEVQGVYSTSIITKRRIDVATVSKAKRTVIERDKVLTWLDALPGGLEAVGGLEVLKSWLLERSSAYSLEARAYGLPMPKGVFLVGFPGCGKTMIARAIAQFWGVALLKLDLGALKGPLMGQSEQKLRKALGQIDTQGGRCVVLMDEIEKSTAGANGGAADGGVAADALGTVLQWANDRTSGAFLIATANDVTKLPPELTRKGRFDELFFVGLPSTAERVEILRATLRQYNRQGLEIDLQQIAVASKGFAGSEVAAIVTGAMFRAFADSKREINTGDLIATVNRTTPLSKTSAKKLEALAEWLRDSGAQRASYEESDVAAKLRVDGRVLDI